MKWSTLPRGSQSSFFLCCTVVLYLAVLRVSAQDLEYYVLQCCWRYSRNSYSYSSPASLSLFRCRVLFTHLAMVQGLQGNNIHFSAAATLCQQIVPHFASQFHGTNLESLAFALATTISCWAIPCWAIATESCDLTNSSLLFPELLLFVHFFS